MTYLFLKRFRRRNNVCLNCLVKSVQGPYIFSHNIDIWCTFRNNIVPSVFEKITETLMRNCDGHQHNYYSCRHKRFFRGIHPNVASMGVTFKTIDR